jgi:hypothetical protein
MSRTIEEIKSDIAIAEKNENTSDQLRLVYELAEVREKLDEWWHNLMPEKQQEIYEAEREGRCEILPCKVGGTVYDRFANAWEVTEIDIYDDRKILARCGHAGTDDYRALDSAEIFLTREAAESAPKEQSKPNIMSCDDAYEQYRESELKRVAHTKITLNDEKSIYGETPHWT